MKDVWKSIRFAAYVIALPLAVTAAVSAHQRMLESRPIAVLTATSSSIPDAPALAGTFRGHSLAVDAVGTMRGRLTSLVEGKLTGLADTHVFLVRGDEIVHLVKTAADGAFEVHGVEPGDYSFIASNKKQFATFGARVISEDDAVAAADVIEVATVDIDSSALVKIIESQVPAVALENFVPQVRANPVPVGGNLVQTQNGRLVGKLVSLATVPLDTVKITIIGADETREITADKDGAFTIENLPAGSYDFVAIGSGSYAVLRFEAIDANDPALAQRESAMVYTSTEAAQPLNELAAPALEVALTLPQDGTIVSEQMSVSDVDPMPSVVEGPIVGSDIGYGVAAGGCCGGCENWGGFAGGCGGCGGFGGGLAGLGKWAILGWILTSLFDEIDFSNPQPPSPAS